MHEPLIELRSPCVVPPEVAERRWAEWWQAMELSNAMLIAGLRHKIGPDGDLAQAYRQWYRAHQERKWQEIMEVQQRRAKQDNQQTTG